MRFALPITTGPRPGLSDYLPIPHGLPGFAAPVEQTFPVLVPFVELSDGRKVVATDGADVIQPSSDGRTLRAHWTHWALIGGKSGEWIDVGLISDVVWHIDNNTFTREEILSSDRTVNIRRWQMAIPSSYGQLETELHGQTRTDRFSSGAGTLSAQLSSTTFSVTTSVVASGNGPLGRGVHGAIPLYLMFEAKDLTVQNGRPLKYRVALQISDLKSLIGDF
jgi:hypothetical protein